MAMPEAGVGAADSPRQALPVALTTALAEFSRHLDAERALSRHTIRAYHGDIQSLFEYAWRHGVAEPGSLDLTVLRGWLASQHEAGAARRGGARVHLVRAPPGMARRRSWAPALYPEGAPRPAAGAAPGGDERGPGEL